MKRLKEHRTDQMELFKMGEDERSKNSELRDGTVNGELAYLKNMLKTMERRMEDEAAFRVKNEDDLRTWFDQKVNSLQERVKNEEKMSLERERKLIEQFQDGLQTLNDIVQGTKEQSVISLSHSQTVLNDSMKQLADTLEEV